MSRIVFDENLANNYKAKNKI